MGVKGRIASWPTVRGGFSLGGVRGGGVRRPELTSSGGSSGTGGSHSGREAAASTPRGQLPASRLHWRFLWGSHREECQCSPWHLSLQRCKKLGYRQRESLMSSCNFRQHFTESNEFVRVLPRPRKGLSLGTMWALHAHWVGGGGGPSWSLQLADAYSWHQHRWGFAQLLLNGGSARNLTTTSFNLHQISLGSTPLTLSN